MRDRSFGKIEGVMMEQYIFGIDIGGTKTAVVLADTGTNFIQNVKFETKAIAGPDQVLEAIFAIMQRIMREHNLTAADVRAIGISCGGPLDDKRGIILSPPNLPGWDEIPIVNLFKQRFGIPTYLRNDADACAIAEWKFGAGRGTNSMIFLTFGTGMGAGLILNGNLYSGAGGLAGEVGHIRLAENGPTGYGKAGSFEGFCSGGGISNLARTLLRKSLSAKEVAEMAMSGDATALKVMQTSGLYLGVGLSILIDLLNPERIIIGGIYMRCETLLRPIALKIVKQETLPSSRAACSILPAGLGEKIGDYSSIAVAIEGIEKE